MIIFLFIQCLCVHLKKNCITLFKYYWKLKKYLIPEKFIYIYIKRLIDLVSRVFPNGLGDLGSIPGRIIPKTFKMVLDTTQQYKVRIKVNMEQSRERSSTLPNTSV